jgi:hypothetical protein
MADLQGWSRGTWGEGDWGEFIPVSVTGVSATISLPNITDGLTLSNTYQSLTDLGSITGRTENIVFQTDSNGILLKSSYTDAEIWWEVGGTTVGAWLGIAKINDAYFIRFRTGSGKNDQQSTGGGTAGGTNSRAVVNLSVSDSSVASYFDDERHIITWAIEISDATYLAGRLRLWIDGNEVITYDPYNDDGNVLRSGQWAGSDSAGYGEGFSQIAGGDGTFDSGATQYQTFTGTSVGSDVYVFAYENQTISQLPIVVNGNALVTPTGVSSGVVLGTAIGEAESFYPLTGVQSNTVTGTLEAQEGHGVIVTGVEMTFADGSEEIIATVDAGWGRNTWGSFAWGENITIFANLVGQELSTNIGSPTIVTGTGETAQPTNVLVTTFTGTLAMTGDALIELTGFQLDIAENNLTILGDGNVTTGGEEQTVETFLGSVNIEIFTQVDATAVTSTFDTGTLAMTGDSNLTLTGEEIVSNTGTITIAANSDVDLTGEQANTEIGVIATQTDNIIPVTGFGLQIQDGAPTIVANATVLPTGVSMQFADGTASGIGSAIVTPTGIEMSVILGNMRSTPWANVVTGANNTWTEVAA